MGTNENTIKSIKETRHCNNSKDKKFLNQVLKNQDVVTLINDSIANGDNNIKTCIIMYLKEYENSKFINPIEINPFIIPSNENSVKVLSTDKAFVFSIKELKEIFRLNNSLPISFIPSEIREFIDTICVHKNWEKLIQIANIITLNKN